MVLKGPHTFRSMVGGKKRTFKSIVKEGSKFLDPKQWGQRKQKQITRVNKERLKVAKRLYKRFSHK